MDLASASEQMLNGRRTNRACQRCRRQKTKCSGQEPCDYCHRRNLSCSFQDSAQKVVVSREYLNDLTNRLRVLEDSRRKPGAPRTVTPTTASPAGIAGSDHDNGRSQRSNASRIPTEHIGVESAEVHQRPNTEAKSIADDGFHGTEAVESTSFASELPHSVEARPHQSVEDANIETGLSNPMVTGPLSYATDGTGRTWFLGTSSNWSFACRAIKVAHDAVWETPFAADSLLFDGTAYMADWQRLKAADLSKELSLPSRDYSLHLIQSVDFHLGSLFHLFDKDTFMLSFQLYHGSSSSFAEHDSVWFVHYLLILAFGKAFLVHKTKSAPYPGAELFVRAQRLLPDMTELCQVPINATEILCCMAMYLQALDFRNSAYNLIGQAKRIALFEGFHTDMQGRNLNNEDAERCRRIWWTIYLLDHQMTSLVGVPVTMRESDIQARLPQYGDSDDKADILDVHIGLTRSMAQIVDTVYGSEGRLDSHFISSMKTALSSIAKLMPKLNALFHFSIGGPTSGLSRGSAHLHLLHHQCIILATRPLLLSSMSRLLPRLKAASIPLKTPADSIRSMLRICTDSAVQITHVLDALQQQNLIDTFLSFDLEATFSAAIILMIARAFWPELLIDRELGLGIAYGVLEEMIARGNIVAQSRKNALDHFEGVLTCLITSRRQRHPDDSGTDPSHRSYGSAYGAHTDVAAPAEAQSLQAAQGPTWSHDGFDSITAVQLQSAADAISSDDLDWFMGSVSAHGDDQTTLW